MAIAMNKNTRIIIIASIAAIFLIAVVWLTTNLILKHGGSIDCGQGDNRRSIDLRDFTTQYWAYSVEFEASLADRGKLSAKLEPKQLQQLSEAMQQGQEFRKFLVAGYNACAITKTQYANFGAKFQALDGLARQINELSGREPFEKLRLALVVKQYVLQSQSLVGVSP
jgi:hypothetical protein